MCSYLEIVRFFRNFFFYHKVTFCKRNSEFYIKKCFSLQWYAVCLFDHKNFITIWTISTASFLTHLNVSLHIIFPLNFESQSKHWWGKFLLQELFEILLSIEFFIKFWITKQAQIRHFYSMNQLNMCYHLSFLWIVKLTLKLTWFHEPKLISFCFQIKILTDKHGV